MMMVNRRLRELTHDMITAFWGYMEHIRRWRAVYRTGPICILRCWGYDITLSFGADSPVYYGLDGWARYIMAWSGLV